MKHILESHRKAHILFVEDDEGSILMAEDVFNRVVKNDFNCVKTGEDALDYLGTHQANLPDLIFIDRRLKDCRIQGDELLSRIRANPAYNNIEIAMMSALAPTQEEENEFANQRVKWVIDKPILVENIARIISSSRTLSMVILAQRSRDEAAA